MSETQALWMLSCAVVLAILVVAHFLTMLVDHLDERKDQARLELIRAVDAWVAEFGPRRSESATESRWPRIIRNGKVNPKPAGEAPPLPVQVARRPPPRRPPPPPPLCCHCGRADCRGTH